MTGIKDYKSEANHYNTLVQTKWNHLFDKEVYARTDVVEADVVQPSSSNLIGQKPHKKSTNAYENMDLIDFHHTGSGTSISR